ncbi:MAG TPA: NAD(P)-dependent oxidoreductase [Allosphingosinicella sp.]
MRILVTGAAGLIGSAVASLLRREHDVIGLDLRPGAEVQKIADLAGPLGLAGFDAIVHVAALHAPHVGRASDAEFRAVNVDATARLLDAALAAGVSRFVFTSTTSLYGRALEPKGGRAAWIDETTEPQPRDIYDETKLAAETLVRAAGLPGAILRMSRCFPEPLPEMALYRLYRGIDRRDVARAHALALEADGGTYVISALSPFLPEDREALVADAPAVLRLRAPEVAARFERLGWPLPRTIDRVYNPARAAAALGFTARYGPADVLDGDCDPAPPLARSRKAARLATMLRSALLLLGLSGCASPVPPAPTRDIYQEVVIARVIGFHCHQGDGDRFDARIAALRPWLDRELGAGQAEAMLGQQHANVGDTDFVSCPSRRDREGVARAIERRLSTLERRARGR